MTLGYIEDENKIKLLRHQYKVMDYSTLAYYKFESTQLHDRYADAFRDQTATPITIAPIFKSENVAAPFCSSIPQKFEQVPYFFKSGGNKYSEIGIPRFEYKGRQIGYTASFWLINFGQHSYSETPIEGRTSNHMLKMEECFAIWYDSPTSFRVYIYAKNNYEEVYSPPVFLPLFEWVNIQITFSQQDGIQIMTFNSNGDRLQTREFKQYLAEQYPHGQLQLFQSFIGVPYQLHIWQQSLSLPIDLDPSDTSIRENEDLIVSYDFTRNYYQKLGSPQPFEGWQSLIDLEGEKIKAENGDGFEFIYMNVPSGVKFDQGAKQRYYGQVEATHTNWNDVTCPSPENSQMFLGSKIEDGVMVSNINSRQGAQFTTAILVDKTQEYTVEFWFKANTNVADQLKQENERNGKSVTYLYQMKDQYGKRAMDIFVEDDVLKCAPFGYNDDAEDDSSKNYILSYDLGDDSYATNPLK